jgi:hypothetical protein
MDALKMKLIEEILDHLSDSQGGDLKSLLDDSKKASMPSMPDEEMEPDGKPKGISIEKVSVMGKKPSIDEIASGKDGSDMEEKMESPSEKEAEMKDPMMEAKEGDEPEMSDDELEEMLKSYLKK